MYGALDKTGHGNCNRRDFHKSKKVQFTYMDGVSIDQTGLRVWLVCSVGGGGGGILWEKSTGSLRFSRLDIVISINYEEHLHRPFYYIYFFCSFSFAMMIRTVDSHLHSFHTRLRLWLYSHHRSTLDAILSSSSSGYHISGGSIGFSFIF